MTPRKVKGRKVSEVFADNLRKVRERRRWTQQDLADRLESLGAPTDRATIARTENSSRGLSLDDALLYSLAVGAGPANVMTIIEDDALISLAPKLSVSPMEARYWIKGSAIIGSTLPLPGDEKTYRTEVSDAEWVVYQKHILFTVTQDVQRLVDAVVAGDKDAIADQIEAVNAGLEQLRRRELR